MTRLRGRSPRGKRFYAAAPCGRWRTTTMIGSVRQDGSTACMTVEGALNAEVFRSYIREILLPTLSPGDLLVMDNLSAHKDREALGLLEKAGVKVRFLPAYSAGSQSDRTDVEQSQSTLSQSRGPPPRNPSPGNRRCLVAGDSKRRHPLVCPLRLWFYLKCSRPKSRSLRMGSRPFQKAQPKTRS
jgi:hypothetical protein